MIETDEKPNLSKEPCGGNLSSSGAEWYNSATHLSQARNIPKQVISHARKQGLPPHHGFCKNNQVNWTECQPWFSTHYDEWVKSMDTRKDGDTLKDQLTEQQIIKLRLENKQKSGELASRAEMIRTMKRLASVLTQEILSKLVHELPPKLSGLDDVSKITVITTKLAHNLIEKLHQPITEWENRDNVQTTE